MSADTAADCDNRAAPFSVSSGPVAHAVATRQTASNSAGTGTGEETLMNAAPDTRCQVAVVAGGCADARSEPEPMIVPQVGSLARQKFTISTAHLGAMR
jgi:hypothetical protein